MRDMPLNFSQRLANRTLRIASQLLPQDDLQPRFCGGGIVKRFAGGGLIDDDPLKKLPGLDLVGSARGASTQAPVSSLPGQTPQDLMSRDASAKMSSALPSLGEKGTQKTPIIPPQYQGDYDKGVTALANADLSIPGISTAQAQEKDGEKPEGYAGGGSVEPDKNTSFDSMGNGSGIFRGKGTGTSDSISTNLPVGGFVMPSETVDKAGEQIEDKVQSVEPALANGGEVIPAKVSDGEALISPEVVNATGRGFWQAMLKNTTGHNVQPKVDKEGKPHFAPYGGEVENEDDPKKNLDYPAMNSHKENATVGGADSSKFATNFVAPIAQASENVMRGVFNRGNTSTVIQPAQDTQVQEEQQRVANASRSGQLPGIVVGKVADQIVARAFPEDVLPEVKERVFPSQKVQSAQPVEEMVGPPKEAPWQESLRLSKSHPNLGYEPAGFKPGTQETAWRERTPADVAQNKKETAERNKWIAATAKNADIKTEQSERTERETAASSEAKARNDEALRNYDEDTRHWANVNRGVGVAMNAYNGSMTPGGTIPSEAIATGMRSGEAAIGAGITKRGQESEERKATRLAQQQSDTEQMKVLKDLEIAQGVERGVTEKNANEREKGQIIPYNVTNQYGGVEQHLYDAKKSKDVGNNPFAGMDENTTNYMTEYLKIQNNPTMDTKLKKQRLRELSDLHGESLK